ncbi:MAG: motility protein A [Planctomycetota bacterium]
MDLGTIAGLLAGTLLVLVSILMGSSLSSFIHVPSMLITLGGAMSATLINFPIPKFIGAIKVVKKTLFSDVASAPKEIQRIVQLATVARREGIVALENEFEKIDDEFLKKGLQLIVDGFPAETVRSILEIDVMSIQDRHSNGKKILDNMANYAPAFGMIGTLMGLVTMLQNLSDPSQIGGGMATALITTFYGAVAANLFLMPLSGKLEARSKEEILVKQILVEGILSIQAGEVPYLVADKLSSFIDPASRKEVANSR